MTVDEIRGTEATASFDYFFTGKAAALYSVQLEKNEDGWSVVGKKIMWISRGAESFLAPTCSLTVAS